MTTNSNLLAVHDQIDQPKKGKQYNLSTCCICMTNTALYAMVPCGHRCMCKHCIPQWRHQYTQSQSKYNTTYIDEMIRVICQIIDIPPDNANDIIELTLKDNNKEKCPICSQHVDMIVKIFDC